MKKSNNTTNKKDQPLIEYYKYLREEIAREDNITHQRITWVITFQGFLVSAMALLIVFGWPDAKYHLDIIIFRRIALGFICILGIVIAVLSYLGVRASRRSLHHVKKTWKKILSDHGYPSTKEGIKFIPDMYPQAYYDRRYYNSTYKKKNDGAKYASGIPIIFIGMWVLFSIVYIVIVSPILVGNITVYFSSGVSTVSMVTGGDKARKSVVADRSKRMQLEISRQWIDSVNKCQKRCLLSSIKLK